MTKQLPNTIRKRTELMEKQITCTQSDVNLLEPNISRTDNNNNNEISRVRIAARAIYLLCRASSDRASQLAANLNWNEYVCGSVRVKCTQLLTL